MMVITSSMPSGSSCATVATMRGARGRADGARELALGEVQQLRVGLELLDRA
jgi:hypothetical protein